MKKTYKTHFLKALAAILVIMTGETFAQVNYQKRIEFDMKDGFDNEEIHAFGKNGFIMSSRSDETEKGEAEWRYELFNTELESVKTKTVKINKKFYVDESFSNSMGLCAFYRDRKGNFSIVSVSASDLEVNQVEGKLPKKSYVNDMVVLGDYAFLSTVAKKKHFIVAVNRETGKSNLIPVIIKDYSAKKTYIRRMQVLDASDEILVFVEIAVGKKKNEIYIIRLNSKGEKTDTYHLSSKFEENIIDISGTSIGTDEYVFTGTYSRNNIATSEGLFFCKFNQSKVEFIKFFNFSQLKEFFNYLPERQQKKVEKKIKKKEKKGKEIVFSYRIADHPVIRIDSDFLFLGEAYYPTYRQEAYTTTRTINGVVTTTTQYRTVFDGYQYTHAVLAKFNDRGELIWDQSFEMWPSYKPYFIKRFISVAGMEQQAINLVFASRGFIMSKSFSFGGDVLQNRKSAPIETGLSGDKSKYSFSNIDFWYDTYFLAYGNQVIKNTEDKSVKRKRKVYFISKVGI